MMIPLAHTASKWALQKETRNREAAGLNMQLDEGSPKETNPEGY